MSDHFKKLVSALSETKKSVGKHWGGIPDLPVDLSQKGRPNPNLKRSREHGFTIIRANYRKSLMQLFSQWDSGKFKSVVQLRKAAVNTFRKYFTKAFQYGMLVRAGVKNTPINFQLQPGHYRWIANAADEEYSYFENFMKDTRSGKSKMTPEQRVEMYVKTLDSIYDAGLVSGTPKDGFDVFHWKLNPGESCPGCIYLSERSPFTRENLPTTPRSGATPCLSNCNCELIVRRVSEAEYNKIANSSLSKKALQQSLKRIKDRKMGTRRR